MIVTILAVIGGVVIALAIVGAAILWLLSGLKPGDVP